MTFNDTVDLVQHTMRDAGISSQLIATTIAELRKAREEEDALREPPASKAKHQFVILTTEEAPELGYVLQIEESAAPQSVIERVRAAAGSFNNSRKGRRVPVTTVGETLQNVGARWFKHERPAGEVTRIKTKEAVAIIRVPNKLPR